jgi:hypothetical protein
MKPWLFRALISLSVAVSCAKATDEKLLDGDDDVSGGSSGRTGGFGGTGFGGTTTGGRGGTTSGGTTGTGGAQGGTGATSGQGGTGGSDGGVGAEGGEGGTDPCMVVGTPPELRLDYKADTRAVTDDPSGQFHVVNGTDDNIPLDELKLRYWFHSEFTCAVTAEDAAVMVVTAQLQNPFANLDISDVTNAVVTLGTGSPGCDAYFEIGFSSDEPLEPDQYVLIGYFFQVQNYTRPHDQSNDYSYGACTTTPVFFERVTLYRAGRLVSGRPPDGSGGEGGAGGESSGGMGGV